jgi:hypothetical protein
MDGLEFLVPKNHIQYQGFARGCLKNRGSLLFMETNRSPEMKSNPVCILCPHKYQKFLAKPSPFRHFVLLLYQSVSSMSNETRKLKVIKYLADIKDESILSRIESTIRQSKKSAQSHPKPFTQKELISRAQKSNQDYLSGNVKSQEHLESESENW